MPFKKYTSLGSFAHVFRGQKRFLNPDNPYNPAKVSYAAKIKLHGTNAGVRITDTEIAAQSRKRDLVVGDDNHGFAGWVGQNVEEWAVVRESVFDAFDFETVNEVIVFGEWAGYGIQNTDAVTKLDQKYFFVFAVQIDDYMVVEPEIIAEIVPDLDELLVLPWHVFCTFDVDYSNDLECQEFAEWANDRAEEVGVRDEFIYQTFGIDGRGEGLVLVPQGDLLELDWYNSLSFKAKTAEHGVKQGKAVTRDLVIPEGVVSFVELFVTKARCEQGLEEACNGIAEKERTHHFLKWMGQDVKKESIAELEDSGLEWKDVSKQVTTAAREWFVKRCERI